MTLSVASATLIGSSGPSLAADDEPSLEALATGSWRPVGDTMSVGRKDATSTLLSDGRVMVAGGTTPGNVGMSVDAVDIYDPVSDSFSNTTMSTRRSGHSATLLADGRVLIAGGGRDTSAEVYDPETDSWSATASMMARRSAHSATLLGDGRVLVAGGASVAPGNIARSAEVYDPETDSWSPAADMTEQRKAHGATLLTDGTVLAMGGVSCYLECAFSNPAPVASAEAYDPSADSWRPVGSMEFTRIDPEATTLADGTVFVTGDDSSTSSIGATALRLAEVYDPGTQQWARSAVLSPSRADHAQIPLSNGTVMLAGTSTTTSQSTQRIVDIYDPASGTMTRVDSLNDCRRQHTGVELTDGRVFVAGSWCADSADTAEVFTPASAP